MHEPLLSMEPVAQTQSELRYALGDAPVFVAAQMGHNDAGELSMSVYASAVRRRERLTGATLKEFDRALEWAAMGAIESANGPRAHYFTE
jgi:hypothetical protein